LDSDLKRGLGLELGEEVEVSVLFSLLSSSQLVSCDRFLVDWRAGALVVLSSLVFD